MRFGRIARRCIFQAELDLLRFAQKIAPVAGLIPLRAVKLYRVGNTLATVAALKIRIFAVFVASPADTVRIFGVDRKFLGHRV